MAGQKTDDVMFDWLDETSLASARVVVPILMEILHPSSVIDVGCGLGSWSSAFRELGIDDVLSVDSPGVDRGRLLVPEATFMAADLTRALAVDRTFDLALCLEVAEHLPSNVASTLVESLVRAAPVVVFSAAIPGQGGAGHVNEQWPDYWRAIFAARNYRQVDFLRERIWTDDRVAFWYRQNTFLYIDEHRGDLDDLIDFGSTALPERIVHPNLLDRTARLSDPSNHSVLALLKALPSATRRAIRTRLDADR